MNRYIKINNTEIETIIDKETDRKGFKGIFVDVVTFDAFKKISFEYNAGGSQSCTLDYQSIINTILKFNITAYQSKVLLKNVQFIIEEAHKLNELYKNAKEIEEDINSLVINYFSIAERLNLNPKVLLNFLKDLKNKREEFKDLEEEIDNMEECRFEDTENTNEEYECLHQQITDKKKEIETLISDLIFPSI